MKWAILIFFSKFGLLISFRSNTLKSAFNYAIHTAMSMYAPSQEIY